MKKITLVRHGEIDPNIMGRYCGWTDADLNDTGKRQGIVLKDKLREDVFDVVYSSDLKRCIQTTGYIMDGRNESVKLDSRLRELNFGDFERKSYEEIGRLYPDEQSRWIDEGMDFVMPSGESVHDMKKRVMGFIEELINSDDSDILVVTHSGVIRIILAMLISGSMDGYWRYKVNNCGITQIEENQGFYYLTCMNK